MRDLCIEVAMEKAKSKLRVHYSGIIRRSPGISAVMATITQARRLNDVSAFRTALATHWPEYLMEGAALGLFMLSACTFGVLLEHPMSPILQSIEDSFVRRTLFGVAMALTAIGIIYSPWGRRSGAHMNPSLTLSFLALGKIAPWDALFYVASQFTGGALGVALAELLLGFPLKHSSVNYVVTAPGSGGTGIAFWAELLISTLMMTMVLLVSNTKRLSRFTGLFAGALVAIFITFEAPFSGMSMNPARTLASGLAAHDFPAIWVYFTAPPIGMILAGQIYKFRRGAHAIFCAKLNHHNQMRCIFRCRFAELQESE
jgi:aquaporin Z